MVEACQHLSIILDFSMNFCSQNPNLKLVILDNAVHDYEGLMNRHQPEHVLGLVVEQKRIAYIFLQHHSDNG